MMCGWKSDVPSSTFSFQAMLIHNTRRKNRSRWNIRSVMLLYQDECLHRDTKRNGERARRFIDQTNENITKGAENPTCVFNEQDNKTWMNANRRIACRYPKNRTKRNELEKRWKMRVYSHLCVCVCCQREKERRSKNKKRCEKERRREILRE